VWFTDDRIRVLLEVFVGPLSAARLNAGKDHLRDVLILHVQGADDLYVSCVLVFYDNLKSGHNGCSRWLLRSIMVTLLRAGIGFVFVAEISAQFIHT